MEKYRYRTGYPFYGQAVGVLVFSTSTARIEGDVGNAGSFDYPVRYEVVNGNFSDLIEGSPKIRRSLVNACRRLTVSYGIRGIVGDCGLMSLYQAELGRATAAPVAASSLCQIPLVWQLIGRSGSIGIITGHMKLLSEKHLQNSGWTEDIPLSIQGMQDETHFREIVIEAGLHLEKELMKKDVLAAAEKLRQKTPDLRAVIIECSNLATYSRDVQKLLGIPVWDTMSAANFIAYGINPPIYKTEE